MSGERFPLDDDADFERLLLEALPARGRPAPFPVDVADAVMARVGASGPPPAAELGPAQLRLWAIGAAAVAAALVVATLAGAPPPAEAVRSLGEAAGAGTGLLARLGVALAGLLGTLGRAALVVADAARAAARPLAPAAPLVTTVLSGAAAAALAASSLIVGRELLARAPRKENA